MGKIARPIHADPVHNMTVDLDSLFAAHVEELRRRADDALHAGGFDGLVAYSGRARYTFLDDRPYPFVVNPHFKHWVPVTDAPDCFVVHVPGARPRLVYFQPADYWHRPPQLPDGAWQRAYEIHVVREVAAARALLGLGRGRFAFIGEWQPEFDDWGFAAVNPPAVIACLHYARAAKTPYELACMRQASLLAARGHVAARDAFLGGGSEYDAHMAYCAAAGVREEELPYGNIVAFNEGGAVLHYQHLERGRGGPRRSFLIDAGAQVRGYASDITRTWSGGDAGFTDLVSAMDALQQRLCAGIVAGRDYRDVHLAAHREIGALLHSAGIVRCDVETAVAERVTSVFFPHGIGHLLGLQVHDVAGLAADATGTREIPRPDGHPYLRLTRTLAPGFVVTVEPGIYFIDLLLDEARADGRGRHIDWKAVERFRPFGGIRIEDDVACTDGAPENLTRAAFAALE
ncbi:MAG: Xaa-Pro dipeptidase [Burkholderiaceae bacterium]|nr:Xaa-Pro dipeptidase [Burkholderiaceae bacterium]